jgi:hypothetical protein
MTSAQGYWQFIKALALWPVREWDWRRWRKNTWQLCHTIVYTDKHNRVLTVPKGLWYDRFTMAPNLVRPFGGASDAAPVHDFAFRRAKWDDGTWMTFWDAVEAFDDILFREGWPLGVRQLYHDGITSGVARDLWNAYKDGRPRAC